MYFQADTIAIEKTEVSSFIDSYVTNFGNISSLSDIKTKDLKELTKDSRTNPFKDSIEKIKTQTDDDKIGISVVDIPSGISEDKKLDVLYGCLSAAGLMESLSELVEDKKSGTPFTLYNASKENEEKLVEAGLKFYSPEDRLGFHTDGLIDGAKVKVPNYIAVYNIMVAYRKPGNFYYLPKSLWKDYNKFRDAFGINKDVSFSMTPIVYAGKDGELVSSEGKTLTCPVFSSDSCTDAIFFNGEVSSDCNKITTLAAEMTESLLDNPDRWAAPIKNRRLFIMNNKSGFHARDIFADPIDGVRYTRSFMRFVSEEGQCIKETA
ncbi:hypothetical protein CP157_03983 (plasmid) [Paracoccus marcusii]|uniref:hypothetical protein n=1 Tax=Paracoccus marcusii TaxID=59779 RepID=UPI001C3DF94A|nr:hypothetical protein [Paracoccus marcusii]QXI66191.1 hypothetical protein CP157_03983 [Paracoccus marcusii]